MVNAVANSLGVGLLSVNLDQNVLKNFLIRLNKNNPLGFVFKYFDESCRKIILTTPFPR